MAVFAVVDAGYQAAFGPGDLLSTDARLLGDTMVSGLAMAATGCGVSGLFAEQLRREGAPASTIPVIGHAQAGVHGYFDDAGYPVGAGWDEVAFPDLGDPNAYALEIAGDSMEPVYRDGDIVVVSPAASLRRGDRVVARTREGEVLAKWLGRLGARRIELHSFNSAHEDYVLARSDLDWIARIVWASQ
ncbi:MAG: helix-turn-helix transcriptional regulator [Alphaproteobacteria bacterium]|nr:helix-turn-helix transcriptional regulator [Alphaproteobacteria bacterium]